MHPTEEKRERAVLVCVNTCQHDAELSMQELEMLVTSADIEPVANMTQNMNSPNQASYLGSGKLEELAAFVQAEEIDLVIVDDELSGTQIRNMEQAVDIPVIDRTMLILEIFSANAHSSEGRLQVALAQHRYLLPRLSGMGASLSRLGGGGGGGGGARRGKGETKLELDRRHIRRHIQNLEEQLESVSQRRDLHRRKRSKDGIPVIAIVGYTNVGKSTLLNALTDAGVLAENKLFATLDPTSRALELPDGREVMLVDTVGFVRRLPHHLVKAFHSTLEEAVFADLIWNVCDISSSEASEQVLVTQELLSDLGVNDTPILTILNQCDKLEEKNPLSLGNHNVLISAKKKIGLQELLEKTIALLPPTQRRMQLLIPYDQAHYTNEIRKDGKVLEESYQENGILISAMVDDKLVSTLTPFLN